MRFMKRIVIFLWFCSLAMWFQMLIWAWKAKARVLHGIDEEMNARQRAMMMHAAQMYQRGSSSAADLLAIQDMCDEIAHLRQTRDVVSETRLITIIKGGLNGQGRHL